jgi:hypothetical protein
MSEKMKTKAQHGKAIGNGELAMKREYRVKATDISDKIWQSP